MYVVNAYRHSIFILRTVYDMLKDSAQICVPLHMACMYSAYIHPGKSQPVIPIINRTAYVNWK